LGTYYSGATPGISIASGSCVTTTNGIVTGSIACDLGNAGWAQALGAIYATNTTEDLLIGGTSTTSADFAFINVVGPGTPTASISGNLTLNAAGTIATTKMQTLNIGNAATGNININGAGTSSTTIGNGTGGLTLHGATTLDNTFAQTSVLATGTVHSIADAQTQTGALVGESITLSGGAGNYNQTGLQFNLTGASTGTLNDITGTAGWNVSRAGAANFVSIGAGTAGTGAFTTLTSSGNTTLASTGGSTASLGNATGTLALVSNAFNVTTLGVLSGATGFGEGSGTFTVNGTSTVSLGTGTGATTVGNGTGGLTLHGATTLDNTFAQTSVLATGTVHSIADAQTQTGAVVGESITLSGGSGALDQTGLKFNLTGASTSTNLNDIVPALPDGMFQEPALLTLHQLV
jgi:hypothetical protein